MKAYVQRSPVDDDGRPLPALKGCAVGIRPKYLTKDGITYFALGDEPGLAGVEGLLEEAAPGMVGVSRHGDVYLVDCEGQAHQLTTRLIGVRDYERVLSVGA